LDAFDEIRLRDLKLFVRLAALGTITAAARDLGVPKPTASRWLIRLEQQVGHQLVNRTTRHAALTERGKVFHDRAQDLLVLAQAARIAAYTDEPRGTLRVSVPLGRLVAGRIVARFREELPGVRLEIFFQNERVDLVKDGIDLAIREPTLISPHIAWLVCRCGYTSAPAIAARASIACQ